MNLPEHIKENLKKDKNYYSLYIPENIERCKVDNEYLEEVLLVHENLIWYSIHKYIGNIKAILNNCKLTKEDLLQIGRMAFIKAIKFFDTSKNVKFSSFAVITIVRDIKYYLKLNTDIVKLSRNAVNLIIRIKHLEGNLGYLPEPKEIAEKLNVSEQKVLQVLNYYKSTKYLEESFNDTNYYFSNLLKEEESIKSLLKVEDEIFEEQILQHLSKHLTKKEYQILIDKINGLAKTEISKKYNISISQINNILKKAEKLIKEFIKDT